MTTAKTDSKDPSRLEARRRWNNSEKGRAAKRRHIASDKRRAAQERYNRSDKGQARYNRYRASIKGRLNDALCAVRSNAARRKPVPDELWLQGDAVDGLVHTNPEQRAARVRDFEPFAFTSARDDTSITDSGSSPPTPMTELRPRIAAEALELSPACAESPDERTLPQPARVSPEQGPEDAATLELEEKRRVQRGSRLLASEAPRP